MTNNKILKIISKGKSSTVEFKTEENADISSLLSIICAFANCNGGHVIIGVSNVGEVVGCAARFYSDIKYRIKEHVLSKGDISPATLNYVIDKAVIDGKNVVCISVKKSKSIHTYKGRVFRRVNTSTVSDDAYNAYKKISRSGVLKFIMHSDSPALSSWQVAHIVLDAFKEWVEVNNGWKTILDLPSASREKDIQRLIDLVGRNICVNHNIDMSFEPNEGPGALDLKLSRGNDKTVIEIKLSSNSQYLHGFETQIEEYARAEGTNNRIFVFIVTGNPGRTQTIQDVYSRKKEAGENPPDLYIIDSQEKPSASKK